MSASDALAAIQTIYAIACKVKDNKDDLIRVSRRIEYIVESLEDSKNRDVIRADEYNDALTTVSELVTRTQRVTRRLLKRSLGDRTWNASEITGEIKRLNEDVQSFLSVHTIKTLDIIQTSHTEKYTVLSNNMEEIMVKIAELDLHLRSPPGDPWATHIQSQALNNFTNGEMGEDHAKQSGGSSRTTLPNPRTPPVANPMARARKLAIRAADQVNDAGGSLSNIPSIPSNDDPLQAISPLRLESLISTNHHSLVITNLVIDPTSRRRQDDPNFKDGALELSNIASDASPQSLAAAIAAACYRVPEKLCEQRSLRIAVTDGDSVYDATSPGGLQISASEPLLWWWNKYTDYHGLAPTTTPLQSVVNLGNNGSSAQTSVTVSGVTFQFHRTLRVPDTSVNNLPPTLGTFPLVPVSHYARELPEGVRQRGGFLMPMFRREALWISFHSPSFNATKVSVGGVNAVSGVAKDALVPPGADIAQDYIVAGRQPWLDGIVTGPGVVRQFVVTELGQGYTVEEQVTGKAEIGGFQFDIFPRRPAVNGDFILCNDQDNYEEFEPRNSEKLDKLKSPGELGIAAGRYIALLRSKSNCEIALSSFSQSTNTSLWTLSSYLRRVSPSASVKAIYPAKNVRYRNDRMGVMYVRAGSLRRAGSLLGVSAGGRISQKVYLDKDPPRVYDEERGHRFYVHIVTPEHWEDITGVLPPITPVTQDIYQQRGIPWFKLFDDYMAGLSSTPETLSQVVSVSEMDKRKEERTTNDNLIDPNAPPQCYLHRHRSPTCVFRPCGHVACTTCLGNALMRESECHCRSAISKFVGMKKPLPMMSREEESAEDENAYGGESGWTVQKMEELSTAATQSAIVTVIHLPQDNVSSLYSLV